MPRFAANLSMLYTEYPFLDRFRQASQAGFKGVEFLFPYAEDKNSLKEKLDENGLTQVLFNLPPGDWDNGERGLACLPDRIGEFQDSVGKAIEYAKVLGNRQVNCLSGIRPQNVSEDRLYTTIVGNLRFAAESLKKEGILLIAEAINFYDMPGFYLNTSKQAFSLFDEVGSDNLKFQYDIYHMQRMEGELANTIKANLGRIAHIQIADTPGRHEPGTGEINYPFLFKWLDEVGYHGWVSCEYRPKAGTAAGLGWMQSMT